MREKDFLYTAAGKAYLDEQYNARQRSTYEIAQERNSYPNLVRRALLHHGYALRKRSDAQKIALERERHPHPTKGKEHAQETRLRISESVSRARRPNERREDVDG